MAVKQIHPDARKLVEQSLSRVSATLSKAELLANMNPVERILRKAPQNLSDMLRTLREARDAYDAFLRNSTAWSSCLTEPVLITMPYEGTADLFGRKIAGTILLYQNSFYNVTGPYSAEEAELVLLDHLTKQKRKAEYLVARKDIPDSQLEYERRPIPEHVRHEVWRRDRARCVQCASVHNLEFDHIIPVSRGGANTARNLQLLCEECNRRKSNKIG